MMRTLLVIWGLSGAWAAPSVAPAEPTEMEATIEGLPPGPPPAPEMIEPRVQILSSNLRCPVCQGMSVAESTTEVALNFQERIRALVTAGYSDEQILDYFVERYGEFMLLDPRARGTHDALWLVPSLALGLGLGWAVFTVIGWRRDPVRDTPVAETTSVEADTYQAQLLAELEEP
jgi:cytochrome c-type biogenesis protein CcmH